MRLNHLVRIRVTKTEKEVLLAKCREMGFPTMNSYLRWCILANQEVLKELKELKYLMKKRQSG